MFLAMSGRFQKQSGLKKRERIARITPENKQISFRYKTTIMVTNLKKLIFFLCVAIE